MSFSNIQKKHVLAQLQSHARDAGMRVINLDSSTKLNIFIDKGVFASDLVSGATYLAQFFYEHPNLYSGKDILDLGCGPGTQGIIMSLYGAKSASFSDINPKAIHNTKKNIELHKLESTKTYVGDLFSELPEQSYDLIVFNHPFFAGTVDDVQEDPNKDEMLRRSMLGGTQLIKRFFSDVPKFLKKNGKVVMPYFHFAGKENDPASHVEEFGFNIADHIHIDSNTGLQQGEISIYILKFT